MSDVEVLFITGTGRSGSTLLANLLGSTDGLFSAGELRFIWDRGFLEDQRCGCSEPFSQCPVWGAIVDRAFGDDPPDSTRMLREVNRVIRVRQLPKLLAGRHDESTLRAQAGYYLDHVEQLYHAAATETGSMLVDSSKLPTYCYLLQSLPSLRLRVVHLVRDPRATAHSWKRHQATGTIEGDDDDEMDRFNVGKASALWAIWNSTARRLFGRGDYLLVRYEDMVAEPRATVDRVRAFAGLPPDESPFVDSHTVSLVTSHAVAGNPNRRRNGHIHVVEDDEWRTALGGFDRTAVTAITSPLLGRLGYSWSTRSGAR